MKFRILEDITDEGFKGFRTVSQLCRSSVSDIPGSNGIYMIIRKSGSSPSFTSSGDGGHFKGKDPNVASTS